ERAEGEAGDAGDRIDADRGDEQTEAGDGDVLRRAGFSEHRDHQDAGDGQHRILGWTELDRKAGDEGREEDEPDDGDESTDERTDRRDAQRRTGAPLERHLMTVVDGD